MAWTYTWPIAPNKKILASHVNDLIAAFNERRWAAIEYGALHVGATPSRATVGVGMKCRAQTVTDLQSGIADLMGLTFYKDGPDGQAPAEYLFLSDLLTEAIGQNDWTSVSVNEKIHADALNDIYQALILLDMIWMHHSRDNGQYEGMGTANFGILKSAGCPVTAQDYLDLAVANGVANPVAFNTGGVLDGTCVYDRFPDTDSCFDWRYGLPGVVRHQVRVPENRTNAPVIDGWRVDLVGFYKFYTAGPTDVPIHSNATAMTLIGTGTVEMTVQVPPSSAAAYRQTCRGGTGVIPEHWKAHAPAAIAHGAQTQRTRGIRADIWPFCFPDWTRPAP